MIETDEGPALFDTGPASALDGLIRSLEKAGISPKDVRHVFVTHIHLDHAGAAWWFARQGAKVYAHVKAVPHLADPFRLWSSVKRLYGSMAETLWGEIHPVPYSNLRVLGDNEQVSLGDVNIIALDTPGHAIHHLAYMVDGAVICGDIGGVRFNKGPAIPPCPPPDINIKDWIHSIERLSA
ncbi:MAG: MBL fold metallo-hydrolase, partial [Deferribacterota bacterium]|nr:MBL fold metallo-hydrolase [Deferribacterota bacterium]